MFFVPIQVMLNPMGNLHFFLFVSIAAALARITHGEESTPASEGFSFVVKKGMPAAQVILRWEGSSLQGLEICAKAGGPVVQRIKIGEGQTIASDLNRTALPRKWIGALDHNGDGFNDIYLQVAEGAEPTYAVLLYDPKEKRFAATKALAGIKGLNVSGTVQTAGSKQVARNLADSFGLVTKEPNQPPKLSVTGAALKKGDAVDVVSSDKKKTIYSAEILAVLTAPDKDGMASYTLDFITRFDSQLPAEESFMGTAVLGAIDGISTNAGLASTRLANVPAGNRFYFRNCALVEGLHFTVWSGKPLTGTRVWHRYHALGYDVDSDCTEKDSAPDKK